jgi:hypothetical protein
VAQPPTERVYFCSISDPLEVFEFHEWLTLTGLLWSRYNKDVPSGSNSVVECDLAKVEVAGSNPVSRSKFEGEGKTSEKRREVPSPFI